MQPAVLNLSRYRLIDLVVGVCVGIEITLVLLDAFVNVEHGSSHGSIRRLFNITREDALPSFFAVTQTVLVSMTLWLIVALMRGRDGVRRVTIGWVVLAIFFTFMAIDDGSKLHERVGSAFKAATQMGESAGAERRGQIWKLYPSYAWQVVFGPLYMALGVFMVVFLWRVLDSFDQRVVVVAALACFVAAVGLDFIEGIDGAHEKVAKQWSARRYVVRHYSKSLEEFLEMFGTTLLLAVFLNHIARIAPRIEIRFSSGGDDSESQ